MRGRIQKWGNSLGLRVPKAFAEQLGLRPGSAIDVAIEGDALIVRRTEPDAPDLAALLGQITPQNVHSETDTGSPTGREIW